MTVLKTVTTIACLVSLMGCLNVGRDIDKFKRYLQAYPAPGCPLLAGTKTEELCYYEYDVKAVDKANGLYEGHVAKKTVEQGVKDCEATKARVGKDFPDDLKDYVCTPGELYPFRKVQFTILPDANGNLPADGFVTLLNNPGKTSMRVGTADEALADPYGKRTTPHAFDHTR
jgi:hypothetical protein